MTSPYVEPSKVRGEAAESQGETRWRKRLRHICTQGSSVEHTGNSEKFRKAVDMTDDELAAIVARAELTVI
jgi:hypothetical protein